MVEQDRFLRTLLTQVSFLQQAIRSQVRNFLIIFPKIEKGTVKSLNFLLLQLFWSQFIQNFVPAFNKPPLVDFGIGPPEIS